MSTTRTNPTNLCIPSDLTNFCPCYVSTTWTYQRIRKLSHHDYKWNRTLLKNLESDLQLNLHDEVLRTTSTSKYNYWARNYEI